MNISRFRLPCQAADYVPRRDIPGGSSTLDRRATSADRSGGGGTSPSSRYASIFISPGRAEAKLLSDDGMDSSNSSNEGSLPRSVASSKGGTDARHGSHLSPAGHGRPRGITPPLSVPAASPALPWRVHERYKPYLRSIPRQGPQTPVAARA